jgi:hypothetical protein
MWSSQWQCSCGNCWRRDDPWQRCAHTAWICCVGGGSYGRSTSVGTGPAEQRHATSSCWIQLTVKQRRAAGRSSGTGWSNGVAGSPNPVTSKPAIWDVLCAAVAYNLLRAAGVLAGGNLPKARGGTLRRKLVAAPARLARPQRKPARYLPDHCPGPSPGYDSDGPSRPPDQPGLISLPPGPTVERWADQRLHHT